MSALPDSLQTFLDVPPNEITWSVLCSRLNDLPEAEIAAMVPALQEKLASWPDELRLLPFGDWGERWKKGESVAAWPLIRTLRFTGDVPQRVLDNDDIGHITGLHAIWLHGKAAATLQALGASPRPLPFKRVLVDSFKEAVPCSAVSAALSGPGLPHLTGLALDTCHFADSEARALAKLPELGRLRGLTLRSGVLKAPALKALLKSKHIKGLERLDVHNNSLGKPGCREIGPLIAEAGLMLRVLRAGANRSVMEEFTALLAAGLPSTLKELEWGFQGVCDEPLIKALGEPEFPELEKVDFTSSGRLTEAGLTALGTSPKLAGLRYLDVRMSHIGPGGVRALSKATALRELGTLKVDSADSYPPSGKMDEAFAELIESPELPSLHTLGMTHVPLEEGFVDALIGSPRRMERLVCLSVDFTGLGEPAIERLGDALRAGAPRLAKVAFNGIMKEPGPGALRAMEALRATGVEVGW